MGKLRALNRLLSPVALPLCAMLASTVPLEASANPIGVVAGTTAAQIGAGVHIADVGVGRANISNNQTTRAAPGSGVAIREPGIYQIGYSVELALIDQQIANDDADIKQIEQTAGDIKRQPKP
jgi:hypothetical protein